MKDRQVKKVIWQPDMDTSLLWKQKKIDVGNRTKKTTIIILSTRTIVNSWLDVSILEDVADIPRSIFNNKQAHKPLQRHTIFIIVGDQY